MGAISMISGKADVVSVGVGGCWNTENLKALKNISSSAMHRVVVSVTDRSRREERRVTRYGRPVILRHYTEAIVIGGQIYRKPKSKSEDTSELRASIQQA